MIQVALMDDHPAVLAGLRRLIDPELTPHHQGQVAACHFPLEDRAMIESSA